MKNSSLWIVLYKMRLPFIVLILTYTVAMIGLLMIDGMDNDGNPYSMSIFDAFYFVTYTATTIGFGETPYAFTYSQKLWVTFSIYLTVLGWFYSIGTLISLFQNKIFIQEIERVSFRKQVKNIKEKFIIILGYNQITSEIIKKAIEEGVRPVVIEKDENRATNLILESFTPSVPILVGDVQRSTTLEDAGIKLPNCKAVVSLFEDEALNLRVALVSKLLNKNITLAIKSTTKNHTENLMDLGVEIITDPFKTIGGEINMAINSPNLLKLEKWIYKISNLNTPLPIFPKGKYIVCGYGRMGSDIQGVLNKNNIDSTFIEIDKKQIKKLKENNNSSHIIVANADDKDALKQAGIDDCTGVIAVTNNDTINLSILITARKLNKNIITIARENELDDLSIFSNANIDHIFVPSNILINKTTNALINPLSEEFVKVLNSQEERWASKLVKELVDIIDEEPLLYAIDINKNDTTQIVNELKTNCVTLDIFRVSLHNREAVNNVIPLLLIRDEQKSILPNWDTSLKVNDKILFACDLHAKKDMEYISKNINEFEYANRSDEKKFK